ncbi:MAG: hypothetical protein JWR15_1399 [Prosthecobacter sp.]|nr:hypothetical protein [Prosthecobacter sp.]
MALAVLACAHLAAAREYLPQGFYGKEPSAWQRAGIEAALKDPSIWVQGHMLRDCIERKWISQLRISTAQWLLWLGHPEAEVQSMAVEAAGQLGAEMPPEVQRVLLRLRKVGSAESPTRRDTTQTLIRPGPGMIPEVQLELVAALHEPNPDYDLFEDICQALGQTGAAMAPATLEALLALMENPQTAAGAGSFAAEALAHLGTHMPPQVRERVLRLLLDANTATSLRCAAAEAMGRLEAQMPPQAQKFLLSVLRDRAADSSLRASAAAALTQTGAQMQPEVQEALLAAYAEPPAEGASADTSTDHKVLHRQIAEALGARASAMPPAVQHRLLELFLQTARTPQPDHSALHSLQKAGPHAEASVLHALLAALQDKGIDEQVRSSIGDFFQRLAEHGHLPLEVQEVVTALVQDEAATLDARCQGALILGQLGEKATLEARHALGTLLNSGGPMLRIHALQAMKLLGPHMPPEAIPVLLTILKKRAKPAAVSTPAHDARDISALVPAGGFLPPLDPLDHVLPALGRLGPLMPPQAPAALLAMVSNRKGARIAAALALAQMGDELPPEIQQGLIAQLLQTESEPEPDVALRTAISHTLSASGLHPVSDALLADVLSLTHAKWMDPDMQRSRLYLWLGRSPAHLQAVRWLGHQNENPPLGDTPPHEILSLISRLWPHAAKHAELRHEMARRTTQILTTHMKTYPLDDTTRKVLQSLSAQLTGDADPECTTALTHVKAALAADDKAR